MKCIGISVPYVKEDRQFTAQFNKLKKEFTNYEFKLFNYDLEYDVMGKYIPSNLLQEKLTTIPCLVIINPEETTFINGLSLIKPIRSILRKSK